MQWCQASSTPCASSPLPIGSASAAAPSISTHLHASQRSPAGEGQQAHCLPQLQYSCGRELQGSGCVVGWRTVELQLQVAARRGWAGRPHAAQPCRLGNWLAGGTTAPAVPGCSSPHLALAACNTGMERILSQSASAGRRGMPPPLPLPPIVLAPALDAAHRSQQPSLSSLASPDTRLQCSEGSRCADPCRRVVQGLGGSGEEPGSTADDTEAVQFSASLAGGGGADEASALALNRLSAVRIYVSSGSIAPFCKRLHSCARVALTCTAAQERGGGGARLAVVPAGSAASGGRLVALITKSTSLENTCSAPPTSLRTALVPSAAPGGPGELDILLIAL